MAKLQFLRSSKKLLRVTASGLYKLAKACCCGSSTGEGVPCNTMCIGGFAASGVTTMPTECVRVVFDDTEVPYDTTATDGQIFVPSGKSLDGSYCLSRIPNGWEYNNAAKYIGASATPSGAPFGWAFHIPDADIYADYVEPVVLGEQEGYYQRLNIILQYYCVPGNSADEGSRYFLGVYAFLQGPIAIGGTAFYLFRGLHEFESKPVCGQTVTIPNDLKSPLLTRWIGADRVNSDQPDYVGSDTLPDGTLVGFFTTSMIPLAYGNSNAVPLGYNGTATITLLDPDKLCCPVCRTDFADCATSICIDLTDDNDYFTGKYTLVPDSVLGRWFYLGRNQADTQNIRLEIYCVGGFWIINAWGQFNNSAVYWVRWYAEQPAIGFGDCPPLNKALWTRVNNDYALAPNTTLNQVKEAPCDEPTCESCHDVYTFALVSRELSVNYQRSTLHTGGDDVPCKWDELEPFGFGEDGDQYGSIVRDEDAGVWRLTYSDDGDPGFTATAPLAGNEDCPPTDIEEWTVGGGEAFSSITYTDD